MWTIRIILRYLAATSIAIRLNHLFLLLVHVLILSGKYEKKTYDLKFINPFKRCVIKINI